jgi:hypothetical protein
VSPKNALLVAAAVAVLGLGVYLFIQVRSHPVDAKASGTHVTAARSQPLADRSPPQETESNTPPAPGTTRTKWEAPHKETTPSGDVPTVAPATDDRTVDLKTDNLMELANKAYDEQDFDKAIAIAGKILSKDPSNVRMLRILVSANCIQGDSAVAQSNFDKLPKFDRDQMKTRCERYGVMLKDAQ